MNFNYYFRKKVNFVLRSNQDLKFDDIKLNHFQHIDSKIKAHKNFARLYQEYIDKKEKYDEYIQTQQLSNLGINFSNNSNLIKEYIDNKIDDKTVYDPTEQDYEYKLIEICNKINKYIKKYDLYIFTQLFATYSNDIYKKFVIFDKFKFETIKKIAPKILSKLLSGDKIKLGNGDSEREIKLEFNYYDDIKDDIREAIDLRMKQLTIDIQMRPQNNSKISLSEFKKENLFFIDIIPTIDYNNHSLTKMCYVFNIEILYKYYYNELYKIYKNILFYEKINFNMDFLQDMTKLIKIDNNNIYDKYKDINKSDNN